MEYKRLGNYIREVNVRNRDEKVTNLQGVSISKLFIPSIANTIGTDMSTYKIVKPGQFAYGPVTSRNGDKVSIALYEENEDAIISQAYTVFDVIDKNEVSNKYLMMWFQRPEFDRYARFHSHGSAREIFDWDELCNVMIPLPSIDRQREIVEEYETLSRRIRLNEQMIQKLEATAQTLYRKMFVDDIDKENLPKGWRICFLNDVCKKITDGVHNTVEDDINGDYYLLSCKNIKGGRISIGEDERRIDRDTFIHLRKRTQLQKGDILLSSVGTIGEMVLLNEDPINYEFQRSVAIIRVDEEILSSIFLFYSLKNQKDVIEQTAHGAVQNCIFISDIANLQIIYPPLSDIELFTKDASMMTKAIFIIQKEISKLKELQSLLLAKMGNLKQ